MSTRRHFVVLRDVAKTYEVRGGSVNALEPTSLTIGEGEFLCVVGPSGCGKSTLLTLISGLMEVTSGEIRIDDTPVRGPYTNVGIAFQSPVLLDWRTALGNVLLQMEMRGKRGSESEEKARGLLVSVGLGDFVNRYPRELSGGMRQRVSIARALVHDPPLLLMDEPFASVDALTRDQLSLDLQHLCLSRGVTVFFITHNIDEAVFLGDRVVVMTPRPGRIAEIIDVELPRPRHLRDRNSEQFARHANRIREMFLETGILRDDAAAGPPPPGAAPGTPRETSTA